MKELTVIEKVMPVISVNFEEMKSDLGMALEKFTGIDVTESNLPECVAMQKELSSVRKGIDGMRLEIKRDLTEPIKEFEDKMKELFNMVVEVETPIKEGIDVFEQRRMKERETEIRELMETDMDESALRPEFRHLVEMDKRWLNKTAKKIDIVNGIVDAVNAAMEAQKVHDETVKAIEETVASTNEAHELALPLTADAFIKKIGTLGLASIIAEISAAGMRQKKAESAAKEQKDQEPAETVAEKPAAPIRQDKDVPRRTITLTVTSTDDGFKALQAFMTENGMEFKKIG